MFTITQIKEHLTAMGHSGTLNKVRYFEAACERAANTMVNKVKLAESQRLATLSQTVHDKLYEYALPSDYLSIIDLYPQGDRTNRDWAQRIKAGRFDLLKALTNKSITIEGSEGTKKMRINWKIRSAKVLNTMDSYNGNGTFSAVGSAVNIKTDTIIKYSGGGSVRFDLVATGDGIQSSDMSAIDLTDEDEIGEFVVPIYFSAVPTSVSLIFGNDLTTNYWTTVAQTTQADGTAFKAGWNIIKFPWSTATETGTVDPATIDAVKITVAKATALADIRVDNILCSIGYAFDIKYYSKYMFQSSAGAYESRPSTDDSNVLCDNDSLQIFLLELLKAIAHQLEGTDSVFDISFADKELSVLYQAYKGEHSDESRKAVATYGGLPRFGR
jgi:hypothetical protein